MDISFLLNNILKHKDSEAIITENRVYLFSDIYAEYQETKELLQKKGMSNGSIVSLIADFNPKSIAMIMALIENDSILVPIALTIKTIDSYIRISQSEFIVDLRKDELEITKTNTQVNHEKLLGLKGKDPGLILFSSGTTGEPKAALHNLTFLLERFKKPGKVLKTVTFLLFDHIGGFNTLLHTLANGGVIVLINSRDPDVVCRAIELHKVELLPTSPTFLNLLLLNKMYEKYDLACLKLITYGTEPMPQATLDFLHGIFPDTKLKQTYGLSEVGIISTKSESSDSLWIKIGGEGVETKIVDDILFIRTQQAMLGYLNAPSPFDDDGWFNTNDKVEIKENGYMKILGRITDIINVGGEKVYPIEVEGILLQCDGVKDVRVYGESNSLMGKIVVAEISVAPENNNKEFVKQLRNYCMYKMEKFKMPVKYNLVDHDLYSDRLKKRR
ncbi:MAG: fatty acid--CoA ligase family protein [Prevotella sp.]|jgi:acyl-coenzyme A synthetase/AMP-(fatty) acid ligase|nr:fatty acid--CoA ligase family protein [Prevotella sp.]